MMQPSLASAIHQTGAVQLSLQNHPRGFRLTLGFSWRRILRKQTNLKSKTPFQVTAMNQGNPKGSSSHE